MIPSVKIRWYGRGVFAWLPAVLVVLGLAGVRSSEAGVSLRLLDSGAGPGGIGSFDIVVENTGTTAADSFFVASFNLQFSIDASSPIQFVGVNTSTDGRTAPYIFGSLQLDPFTRDTFPTQSLTVGDTLLTYPPGYIEVHAGEVFGLSHVLYQIDASAPLRSSYPVHLDQINKAGGSELFDFFSNVILIDAAIDGQISVVPEPASVVLACLVSSLGLALGYRRRRESALTLGDRS